MKASLPRLKTGQIVPTGPPGWGLGRADNPTRKTTCYEATTGASDRTDFKTTDPATTKEQRFAHFLMERALPVQR